MTIARKRWIIISLALAMMATAAFTPTDAADAAEHDRSVGDQPIKWRSCFEDLAAEMGVVYECSLFPVPLDYDNNRETITLSLVRIPATAEPYLGSLFLNPGGPGGSGVDFALFFGPFAQFVWGPVANQYDIVGFDPRGIMRSSPLLCFDSLEEAFAATPPHPFPITRPEVALTKQADDLLNHQCAVNGTVVRDHMSTANVARDLDRLRHAVGDDYLNYVGLSYGSYLGQTYANLFPDNVGAMVIDGVLDPIAWANLNPTVPFSTELRSDVGAQATWEEFSRQCDEAGPAYCALAPDSFERVASLLDGLRESPILLTDPETGDTFPYIYSFGVVDLLVGLYNPFGYAEVAQFFAFLESQASAATLGAARQEMQEAVGLANRPDRRNYPNFVEGFPAVACEDTTAPRGGHRTWYQAAQEALEDFGIFGEAWTWLSSPCASWSHFDDDVYKGPYDTATAHPMLVIGNLYDPATPLHGAVTANGLLEDSALMTVDEPGHTSLGINACAGITTGQYLAEPSHSIWANAEIFCPAGENWFIQAGGAGASSFDAAAAFRTELMDQIALRP